MHVHTHMNVHVHTDTQVQAPAPTGCRITGVTEQNQPYPDPEAGSALSKPGQTNPSSKLIVKLVSTLP